MHQDLNPLPHFRFIRKTLGKFHLGAPRERRTVLSDLLLYRNGSWPWTSLASWNLGKNRSLAHNALQSMLQNEGITREGKEIAIN